MRKILFKTLSLLLSFVLLSFMAYAEPDDSEPSEDNNSCTLCDIEYTSISEDRSEAPLPEVIYHPIEHMPNCRFCFGCDDPENNNSNTHIAGLYLHRGTKAVHYDANNDTIWSFYDEHGLHRPIDEDDIAGSIQDAIVDGKAIWGSHISMTFSQPSNSILKFVYAPLNRRDTGSYLDTAKCTPCYGTFDVVDENGEQRQVRGMYACLNWDTVRHNSSHHITGGIIYIDDVLFMALSPAQRANIIAHEIGHFYGLGHSSESDSIMKRAPANISTPNNNDYYGMSIMTHQVQHLLDNFTCAFIDEDYHRYKCLTCNKVQPQTLHTYGSWEQYTATYHRRLCDQCQHYQQRTHNMGNWRPYNANQHRKSCSVCPRNVYQNHSFLYSGGMLRCDTCGYEKPYLEDGDDE